MYQIIILINCKKNYDTKFEKIDSSRRRHSLMYKDEGGNAVDSEMGGDGLNNKGSIILKKGGTTYKTSRNNTNRDITNSLTDKNKII